MTGGTVITRGLRVRWPTMGLAIWAVVVHGFVLAAATAAETDGTTSRPAPLFTPDLNREADYLSQPPDQACPIPELPVNRSTYYKWLEFSRHFRYADNPATHGQYGPRHFLPVLAYYVESGDRQAGLACIAMLKAFHEWVRQEVAAKGWHALFCQEMGYIGLYREHLARGRLLSRDDVWFRELVLDFARGLHPWGSPQTYWRGPMHRAQGEGVVRGLAARWYPDAPEADEWRSYSDLVYEDWWRFRDFAANDTNYLFATLQPLFLRATLLNDDEFFADPKMAPVWDRLMEEVSPDGSVPPYGANLGWNDTAGMRIAMLEMLASRTGDGRYRYVAHRLMNYLVYQRLRYREHHMLLGPQTTEPLALAFLFTDDSIAPVAPDPGSTILYRKETVRLPGYGTGPQDKALAKEIIGPVDQREDRGFIDCGLLLKDTPKPSKLVLRSGWKPGDFYVLVDLFPRHDPLNPLGILGMTRWGAALTCAISAKGFADENRVIIKPHPTARNLPSPSAEPETLILDFADSEIATYASASVDRYESLPITCARHFVFVKNEFLFFRDDVQASAPFEGSVASVFNTQNIGPRVSAEAALTYMSQPAALDIGLLNPAVDLLVYQCPQDGARMASADRTATDPRTQFVRGQVRYEWNGSLAPDRQRHFTTLLRPQPPAAATTAVSSDAQASGADVGPQLDTRFISVVLDDDRATVLRIDGDDGRQQWVVVNPTGGAVTAGDLKTDARAAYIETRREAVTTAWRHKGKTLRLRDREVRTVGSAGL